MLRDAIDFANNYVASADLQGIIRGLLANGELGRQYLADMDFALGYAKAGRLDMLGRASVVLGDLMGTRPDWSVLIECHQNFVRQAMHFGDLLWVHRAASGRLVDMTGNQLEIRIDPPFEGKWCLVLCNSDDATYALFDELELQGGGYTWAGIAHALVDWKAPELNSSLDINAEGDEMYVYASEGAPLERLEGLLRMAAGDHELLRAVIERAGESLE